MFDGKLAANSESNVRDAISELCASPCLFLISCHFHEWLRMNDRSFVDSNIWLYAFVLRPAYGVAEKVSSSSSAVSSIGFLFFFGGLNNEYSDS